MSTTMIAVKNQSGAVLQFLVNYLGTHTPLSAPFPLGSSGNITIGFTDPTVSYNIAVDAQAGSQNVCSGPFTAYPNQVQTWTVTGGCDNLNLGAGPTVTGSA